MSDGRCGTNAGALSWVDAEIAGCRLGDKRLVERRTSGLCPAGTRSTICQRNYREYEACSRRRQHLWQKLQGAHQTEAIPTSLAEAVPLISERLEREAT
jgi:hypothetical protein